MQEGAGLYVEKGGAGGRRRRIISKNIKTRQTVNPKREEGGIDCIVVKRGTGGKYKNVKDKIYMERKGSNNVAEIVRNGLIISWRRGGRGERQIYERQNVRGRRKIQ